MIKKSQKDSSYKKTSLIEEVLSDPIFKEYGRLIFPVQKNYYSGKTLEDLSLTWYSNIDPNKTVEIINYFQNQIKNNQPIFFDIYTDQEKREDPKKKDTGLFFFKGKLNEKFAICNAGGGFAYVGAIHDSFPQALELSKLGYNAFALIYRPNPQNACEDLARAISFIFQHAHQLEVDTNDYSLWGGSAGARMAAYLGRYGSNTFGEGNYPKPSVVIMQYTGYQEFSKDDSPTYACVGTHDYIANWRVMQHRLQALFALGIPTEFHAYKELSHGFGLGTNTIAQGWLNEAVTFWKKQMKDQKIQ